MSEDVRYMRTPNGNADFAFSRLMRVTHSLNQTELKGMWSFSLSDGDEPRCEITYEFTFNGESLAITLKASTGTIEYGPDANLKHFLRKEIARQIGAMVWKKSGQQEGDDDE